MLKDHIDLGFADHVDEQLLHFDDDGNLVQITDGKSHQKKAEGGAAFSALDSIAGRSRSYMGHDVEDELIEGDSVSSSAIDDGMSSMTGGQSKSVVYQDSASISNFK